MLDRAIGIAGLSLAFIFGILQYYLPQLPMWASAAGIGVGIFLLGVSLGHLWIGRASQPKKIAERALLRLHVYADHRVADALASENIFRWYQLRQAIVVTSPDGTEKTAFPSTILFVTFEPEVRITTLKVQSPDITLPPHEVKEFNQRFAIVVFMGELSTGTVEVSVQP